MNNVCVCVCTEASQFYRASKKRGSLPFFWLPSVWFSCYSMRIAFECKVWSKMEPVLQRGFHFLSSVEGAVIFVHHLPHPPLAWPTVSWQRRFKQRGLISISVCEFVRVCITHSYLTWVMKRQWVSFFFCTGKMILCVFVCVAACVFVCEE